MGDYLKLFKTHSEYAAYSGGGEMLKPNVSYCRQENEVHYNPLPHDYSQDYLTFVAKGSGTFTFSPQNSNTISYSKNNGDWTVGNEVTVDSGDKVLWKGPMTPSTNSGVGTFSSTAKFDVQGNAMSLLFGDGFKGEVSLTGKNRAFYQLFYQNAKVVNAENLSLPATTLASNCYYQMFYGCTALTTAPVLPATTLAIACYSNMFRDCTSLTTAPVLPATTLANECYYNMFDGCTSLTTAPVLPATTLANYCYQSMFYGCTSLTTAPELPATTLANYCYQSMFNGCTSLATAPELPVTTLAIGCYQSMFNGCTSLATAPELPATTLASDCYQSMFYGCTSLTTAPVLPATTLASKCYQSMFFGCSSLNYIKAMFTTTPSTSYTKNWVSSVSSTGTFVKNSAAGWDVTGVNGVPTDWTVEKASV